MQLRDRTFLLLGGSGGIGRALGTRLAGAGVKLVIASREPDKLEPDDDHSHPVLLDLAAPDLDQQLQRVSEQFPDIDGVIHCAGQNLFQILEATDVAAIDRMLAVNLRSTLLVARHFVPRFRALGWGNLMFVGSTFGSIGFPGYAVYSATKFGVRGFSEALRRELADSKIGVHYIAPRATRTGMNSAGVDALNKALGNTMDSPERVASQIMQALLKDRNRAYLGWPEKLFVHLNGLLPRLVDAVMRKQLPVIRQFLAVGDKS